MYEIVTLVATFIAFISGCWYAVLTYEGKTQPNRVTYFLWFLFPTVIFSAQVAQGLYIAAIPTLAVGLPSLAVFVLSFKNPASYWHIRPYSFLLGGLGFVAIPLWLFTDEPNLALGIALFANIAAFIPTLIKAFLSPISEDYRPYMLSGVAFFVVVLVVPNWTFATIAFPLYLFFANTALTILAHRKQVM